MKEILLTKGFVALVDDEDFEAMNQFKWYRANNGYAFRAIPHPVGIRRQTLESMHRRILGLEFGNPSHVDHADGNRLNNQRSNIRVCTHAENLQNKPIQKNNTSGFKGVCFNKTRGKFQASIHTNGTKKFLGYFSTASEAHIAYCIAADQFHGEFANHGNT